jgi:hypothetical protein
MLSIDKKHNKKFGLNLLIKILKLIYLIKKKKRKGGGCPLRESGARATLSFSLGWSCGHLQG